VWRQKEAALQSSQLTRLLLANSAHEVRTPLNAIINYLEIALEGALDQETRDNLAKSHSASKSLIYVINDLLDLTKAEEGQELIKDEVFDLPATVREATDSFKGEAKRKGLGYEVIEHPGCRSLFMVISAVFDKLWLTSLQTRCSIRTAAMFMLKSGYRSFSKIVPLSRLWCRIVGLDCQMKSLTPFSEILSKSAPMAMGECFRTPNEPSHNTQGKGNRTLGLGLAVVARTVRNMDGQLRLKSEEGKGSRFVIQLPFILPEGDESTASLGELPSTKHRSSKPTCVNTTTKPKVKLH